MSALGRSARLFALLSAVACAGALSACTAGGPAKDPHALGVTPAAVSEEEFGRKLVDSLARKGAAEERPQLLLGVVRRQMLHAKERFARGAAERGTKSLLGGLYLLGEQDRVAGAVDAETKLAIDGAISKLSARGDLGRTRVLLALRKAIATPAEAKEIAEHAAALETFQNETLTGRAMERAGDAQRAKVAQALIDPPSIPAAIEATSRWIDQAIEENVRFQQTGKRPPPEEATEIVRALESGGMTVVALSLRYGDVEPTMQRVAQSSARLVLEPDFFAELNDAFKRDDAQSFRDLYDAFIEQAGARAGSDVGLDQELFDVAKLTLLVEAYRRDTKHVATAVELAQALSVFGMSEATPVLMDDALGDDAAPADVVRALRLVGDTVESDARADDLAGAARTIAASQPLLSKAKKLLGREHLGGVADLRYAMASELLRGGYVGVAEPLIAEALEESPRASGYLIHAQLKRQSDAPGDALADAGKASQLAADPLDLAEARLLEFELHRDAGRSAEAGKALAAAFASAAPLAGDKKAGAKALRAQRTLGRVLTAYGDRDGARKAWKSALDLALGERPALGATMLDAIASGLVLGDVEAMRAALRRGVDGGAAQDDVVYGALWLTLTEKQLGVKPDEMERDLLDAASGSSSWIGQLAAWSQGRTSDAELGLRAPNEAARVEASFYAALGKRASGGKVDEALRSVAKSAVIHLLEVRIARDLLAPPPAYGKPVAAKSP